MIYGKSKKDIVYYFFLAVIFITPHLPMPTSILGPVGPAIYFGLTLLFILNLLSKPIPISLKNYYFKALFFCQIFLLMTDVFRLMIFDPESEFSIIPVRIVNTGIFIMASYYFIDYSSENGHYVFNKKLLNAFVWSVFVVTIVFYLQAFGLLTFGHSTPGRTFFGVKLPFRKPIGLVEISDGKIGTFVVPVALLFLVNYYERFRFFEFKRRITAFLLLSFIVVILQSRSGYLGFAISLLLFFLLYPSTWSKFLKILVGFVGFIVIIFSDIYLKIWAGLVGRGIYETNVDSRSTLLNHAIDQFKNSPIIGVGHDKVSYQVSSSHSVGAHNLFLDHLGSGGLITIIPLVLLFLIFFYYAFKSYYGALRIHNTYLSGLSLWLILSMTHIVVELSFYRGLYNEYVYLILGMGGLVCLNYSLIKRKMI